MISVFAMQNKVLARIVLTILHCALVICAMQTAALLDRMHVVLPGIIPALSLLFVFTAIVISRKKLRYTQSRIIFFACGLSLFVSMCFFYNNNRNVELNIFPRLESTVITPREQSTPTTREQKKELRKLIKELRTEMKKAKATTGQVIGTILVVLGAIGLLLLVAGLACSLSCNGSGALALLVGIGGTVGVIMLMIWAMKKINRKKTEPEVAK